MKPETRFCKEHRKWQEYDPSDREWAKLDDIEAGDKVEIHWKWDVDGMVEELIDEGYVFELPWSDEGCVDFYVHVPNPGNPGGKDSVGPEWRHIRDLMQNEYVQKIKRKE